MGYHGAHASRNQATFFWHDYETTGTHKQLDRPTQFAGLRTDEDLNIVGEPVMVYCQPSPEALPHPMAVAVTGITPQECQAKGLSEADFAAAVLQQLGQPGTCGVGYNTITFDDEMTRNLLFRNFQDPYAREWQNGNSRWDLLVAARMCYALRPDGIVWPTDEDGKANLKLENLARVNHLKQERAHDALSDVEATIGLARLIRDKQRGLYDYALGLRNKKTVDQLLGTPITSSQGAPLVHVAPFHPRDRRFTALVGCLGAHPTQNNARVLVDLTADLHSLFDLDVDGIAERLFGGIQDDEGNKSARLPVTLIQINKAPALSTMGALRPEDRERLGYTAEVMEQGRNNLAQLRARPDVAQKVIEALRQLGQHFPTPADPELAIYDGFPSPMDKAAMARVQTTPAEALTQIQFQQDKFNELLFRYRARNFPHSLSADEKARWEAHRYERLVAGSPASNLTIGGFREALAEVRQNPQWAHRRPMFDDLERWAEALVQPLMAGATPHDTTPRSRATP